ncbi:MAG: TetR/AcrR family transcriptional regulator [Sphingomonadales bacterium]|jgi:AcrR family transcriptional regulator
MIERDAARKAVVERLVAHLLATGLSQCSLRQLAAAAGVSDRMLLYYFKDKADVLASTMAEIAAGIGLMLDQLAPPGARLPPAELLQLAVNLAVQPATRPFMQLWIEVVAAAARDEAPFAAVAAEISAGFFSWIESRLAVPAGADAAATATLLLALVDGLALVAVCAPDRAAAAAAVAGRIWSGGGDGG